MAIQEYEFQPAAAEEEEISPLEHFKDSLHGMVMEVESSGYSALGHLLIIRSELKRRQVELMRESYMSIGSDDALAGLQEEMVLTYHKQVWTEGYIGDRQPN